MKDRSWIEVKEAANRCVSKINSRVDDIWEDYVRDVACNNLPSVLKSIAVYSFIHGKDAFGADALIIRNGLEQLEHKGYITFEKS